MILVTFLGSLLWFSFLSSETRPCVLVTVLGALLWFSFLSSESRGCVLVTFLDLLWFSFLRETRPRVPGASLRWSQALLHSRLEAPHWPAASTQPPLLLPHRLTLKLQHFFRYFHVQLARNATGTHARRRNAPFACFCVRHAFLFTARECDRWGI